MLARASSTPAAVKVGAGWPTLASFSGQMVVLVYELSHRMGAPVFCRPATVRGAHAMATAWLDGFDAVASRASSGRDFLPLRSKLNMVYLGVVS